jgi:PhoH-like ATPase
MIDTNIFFISPECVEQLRDTNNEIFIPTTVLDELDNAKTRPDEVGRNARLVTRTLDELRSSGSLSEGVKLNESIIRVELNFSGNIPDGLSVDKMDNKILSTAIGLKNSGKNVIVVSKDINLRVKCDVCGIEAQDYNRDKIAENAELIYGGVQKIFVDSKIIDELYSNKKVEIKDFNGYLNQFVVIKSNSQENHVAIGKYIGDNTIVPIKQVKDLFGICARNAEQRMAIDLLLDPNINLVTLIGSAGTGKTLLAIAAAKGLLFSADRHTNKSFIYILYVVYSFYKIIQKNNFYI